MHHSSSPLFLKACTITAFFRCNPEGKMSRGIFRPEFREVLSPCLNPIGVKGIKQGFDLKHVLNCFAESEPMFWFLPQECIIHTEICSQPIKGQRSLFPYLHSCGKLPWGSSAVKGEPVTAHRWRTVLLMAVIQPCFGQKLKADSNTAADELCSLVSDFEPFTLHAGMGPLSASPACLCYPLPVCATPYQLQERARGSNRMTLLVCRQGPKHPYWLGNVEIFQGSFKLKHNLWKWNANFMMFSISGY